MRVPAEPASKIKVYDNFKGVDFAHDPLLCDDNRSPNAVNLISDNGSQPEKRPGFRILQTMEQPINGIAHGTVNGNHVFIAHGGTKLYTFTPTSKTEIKTGVNNARSAIFFSKINDVSKCFILTGTEYLVYDGTAVKSVSEIATVPVILIDKKPSGGGTQLDYVNLIQPKRTEKFKGDGTTKLFQLAATSIDATTVVIKEITASGEVTKTEGTDFTVNRTSGQITFNTAPPKPAVTGEDNIYITYAKTVTGYADRVQKCLTIAFFGYGGDNRVFITRNPDYKAQDWWSEINDPTYFPDLNYAIVGTTETAVIGYSKLGKNLVISKEDNQNNSTIFLRSAEFDGTNATFPITPGIAGKGAYSPYSFATLIDEPLFLSRTGIFAITSNVITAEKTLQNRSYYIDPSLTKEPNLDKATACEWNGYYIISVNGHAYLLDSRQKAYEKQNNAAFTYECFYWENINATCFMVYNGELYWGDSSGNICKLNTDIADMTRYNDNGVAIKAEWQTKMDDDGLSQLAKTLHKKGFTVTTKPITRSSVKVSYKTSGMDEPELIKDIDTSIQSWLDVDFSAFTFNSNDNAQPVVIKKKVKKYQALQIILSNEELNQGIGIFQITKEFEIGNYIKE